MNKGILFVAIAVLLAIPVMATDVNVGVYVLNLGKFDISTGSYTVDFYLSLSCDKECSPDFEFMNGRAATTDTIINKPNEKFYRIQANLNSPVDLRSFPFDAQSMRIIIEDKTQTGINYVPDINASGIDPSIAFTGWDITGWNATESRHDYPVYGETYSQYAYSIDIRRAFASSFLKTFLPVFFIMLIVLCSFLLDPDKITTRLGMAGSALVASVMFHVSIANSLPPVGYLTFADKFMLLTYFILLATFIMNVIMIEYQEQKREWLVMKIHRATEWTMFILVPLLYILLFLLFI